jgi:hypothetical protein
MNYEEEFLRYLRLKEIIEKRKIIQKGGLIEKVKIGEDNIEYDVKKYGTKKDMYLQVISSKKANDKQPSFIMHIKPGSSSELIHRGKDCFQDNHDESSDIVLAALEIARLKGAKTFEFTDNSTKTIDSKKIRLSNLSFLTTGKTWYERILSVRLANPSDSLKLDSWRKNAYNNTWANVQKMLLLQKIQIDIDFTGINIYEPGSAMKVLERAKLSKSYVNFFNECMDELMIASLIPSLHGKHWIMDC